MEDMGNVSLILEIHITRYRAEGKLKISQGNLIKSLLERVGMSEYNAVYPPGTDPELSATQRDENLLNIGGIKLYQAIVGSVVYLGICNRFDIIYAVSQLTRAMSKPAIVHMTAAKHLFFCYLKGSPDLCIGLQPGTSG